MQPIYVEIAVAIMLGMCAGAVTGLTPGVHVNLVAASLVALSPALLQAIAPLTLCVFIMSVAVSHSFLDTIPSTFLGAPDEENALSVLPAHKMLLKGEAYSAVKLSVLGAFCGLILACLLAPVFIIVSVKIFAVLKPVLKFVLVGVASFLIFRDADKLWSLILFLLSGALGLAVFSLSGLREPLFALLSGLFGVSGLLISYFDGTRIPVQKINGRIDISVSDLAKSLAAGTIGVFAIQFFPGTGPSQGAVLSTSFIKEVKEKAYLVLIGAMGTMSVVFSLATFFALGKTRDGSIVALSRIMEVGFLDFLILMLAFLAAGSASAILTLILSGRFSRVISVINYKALVVLVIAFIIVLSYYFDGFKGLLILATASSIGLIAPLRSIPRSHAMGCLLLPVILYLLF